MYDFKPSANCIKNMKESGSTAIIDWCRDCGVTPPRDLGVLLPVLGSRTFAGKRLAFASESQAMQFQLRWG